uniref:NXPE C-terminal domain-containing protein n=1 Tax=Ciona intestinalis TaxID=7719 RepID=F6SY14_CIOIN
HNTAVYKVGDTLVAKVEAYDGLGRRKRYGGDYFFARLINTDENGDELGSGIGCNIIDRADGSYTISAPLLWPGNTTLFVDLVHPSEAVAALVYYSAAGKENGITFVSTYPTGEQVYCNVGIQPQPSQPLCDFSQPEKGGSWFCLPTADGGCPGNANYTQTKEGSRDSYVGKTPLFLEGSTWKIPINFQGGSIMVKNSSFMEELVNSLPICESTSGKHSGFYLNHEWQSLQCKPRSKGIKIGECLRHKVVYFIGDSTMRQWYTVLLKFLKFQDHPTKMRAKPGHDVWQAPRVGYLTDYNITFYYRSHGKPMYNPGPPESHAFIADTLNEIKTDDGHNILVVINIALHFQLIDPIFYLQRVEVVKRSVIELQLRSPGVRVFIRGCIRHRNSVKFVPTEWYSFRLCKILRKTFETVPGVGFIDTWQMTTVYPNHKNIHPKESVILEHIALFLSYLC